VSASACGASLRMLSRLSLRRRCRGDATAEQHLPGPGMRLWTKARPPIAHGTFGRVEINVPRAKLKASEGKTTEWRSKTLPAYQRRTQAANQQSTSISLSAHRVSIRTFLQLIHLSFGRPWVSPEIRLSLGIVLSRACARPSAPAPRPAERPRRRAPQ
jgi:hypothetical protein